MARGLNFYILFYDLHLHGCVLSAGTQFGLYFSRKPTQIQMHKNDVPDFIECWFNRDAPYGLARGSERSVASPARPSLPGTLGLVPWGKKIRAVAEDLIHLRASPQGSVSGRDSFG
jgi:hypothetical protein